MAGFVRRFNSFPTLDVITEIEGVDIIDLIPPGINVGLSQDGVCLVGEWPGGPTNTPVIVEGDPTIRNTFGGFSLSLRNPLAPTVNPYSNGAAFPWLKNKRFRHLVLVRPDMSVNLGVALRVTSSPSAIAAGSIVCPAQASLVNNDFFILNDGINPETTFEYQLNGSYVQVPGRVTIDISAAVTAINVADATRTAILSVTTLLRLTPDAPGSATIALVNDFAGEHGNQLIREFVANAGFTVSGMSGGTGIGYLLTDLLIPAGTRVRDASVPTVEYALAQNVILAAGTNLAAAAFTVFGLTTPSYSTRTVSGIPVYSVQGVAEGAVGDIDEVVATDLFRAGIGAGAAYPTLLVAASTGALDGSAANALALTVLTSSQIDTRYADAINASLPGEDTTDRIAVIAAARTSPAITQKLFENARDASNTYGRGRTSLSRAPIGTTRAGVLGSAAPGVGVLRSDRKDYCYPHFEQLIPELAELDPTEALSPSVILLGADSCMATILANLPPENNPGQSTQSIVTGGLLSFILRLEPGLTTPGQPTKFTLDDYIAFKAGGVAALRRDTRISEWVFQSGVTSVDPLAFPSLAPIKRRRMADFIQDSMAAIALRYNKQPNTTDRYDSLVGDEVDFLEQLLSTDNPARQRIAGYSVDSKSGNTPELVGTGIRVIIFQVQLLDTLDYIVLQTEIGESVSITSLAA